MNVAKLPPLIPWRRFWRAVNIWFDRDGGFLAAAIAFYTSLSIIPFFALSVAMIDWVVETTALGRDAHEMVMLAIEEETSPQLRTALEEILQESRTRAKIEGPITLAWLFVMSLVVFSRVDRAFGRIWTDDVARPISLVHAAKQVILNRARATVLFLGYGVGLVSVFVFSLVAQSLEHFSGAGVFSGGWLSWVGHSMVAIVLNSLFFQLLFLWLSREKIRWRDALQGAIFLAISWELGRQAMALAIIGNQRSLYGVLGSFMAILLWTYYASALVLYWGAYVKCLHDDHANARLP